VVAIAPSDALPLTHDAGVQTFRVPDKHGLSILVRLEYRETLSKAWLQIPHHLIDFLTPMSKRFA